MVMPSEGGSRQKERDDVNKWKYFPPYRRFVRGIHGSPVNFPHKGQWRGALMFSFISTRINGWINNREAGDLRRHRAHYDIIVMMHKNAGLMRNLNAYANCNMICAYKWWGLWTLVKGEAGGWNMPYNICTLFFMICFVCVIAALSFHSGCNGCI